METICCCLCWGTPLVNNLKSLKGIPIQYVVLSIYLVTLGLTAHSLATYLVQSTEILMNNVRNGNIYALTT